MKYEVAFRSVEAEGFKWELFQEYFPFGDEALGEGDYQRLLGFALLKLETDAQRQILLDLLDAQACVLTEQVWVIQEMTSKQHGSKQQQMSGHFPTAWLQINENFRREYGLELRRARDVMFKLGLTTTLIQKIVSSS